MDWSVVPWTWTVEVRAAPGGCRTQSRESTDRALAQHGTALVQRWYSAGTALILNTVIQRWLGLG